MRHRTIILTVMLALTSSALSAQVNVTARPGSQTISTSNMETYDIETIDGVSTIYYDHTAPNIHGSPYLNSEFQEGTMTVLNGTVVPGLRYRYDIYGDKMLFIVNGDTAVINKPLALKSIQIGDRSFVYEVFKTEADRVATSYFEVVEKNEYLTLLHRRQAELDQDVYVSNYGGGGGTKEFSMKTLDSYYMKVGDHAAREIGNRKDLLELFPVYREEIRDYMKVNHLKVRNEEDLKSIAHYYLGLMEPGS